MYQEMIRNPKRYGGLLVFSGGYIGGLNTPREPSGDLNDTPVFIGCSDMDPHIPLQRVQETTSLLRTMGAQVTEKIYPYMGHMINEDEIESARRLMEGVLN